MTFEERVKRLEEIVAKIDEENTGLEEANKLFEEGVELIKICYAGLNVAKGKMLEIKNTLDGLKIEEVEN